MIPDLDRHADPVALLGLCELFCDVDPDILASVTSEVSVIRLVRGAVLVRAGEPSDCLYTVVSGRLQVTANTEDGAARVSPVLGPGETAGFPELMGDHPRPVTVVAVRDCELVRLSRAGFGILALRDPRIMTKVARALAQRLHQEERPPLPPVRTIVVMPAGRGRAGVEFGRKLSEALGAFGPTLHLKRQTCEEMFGSNNVNPHSGVAGWLSHLDRSHRFVVLEAEPALSPWTRLCLGLADRILAVAHADELEEWNEVERHILDPRNSASGATLELVLLHGESRDRYQGSARWLKPRRPLRHHHLRLSSQREMKRLARILAGQAIGLTLGGGGARGLAHIGVIRAFQESGIPIDMIGGVSMGAVIAGMFAMGLNWKSMLDLAGEELVGGGFNSDFTLPLVSVTSGRRFKRALDRVFGDVAIEDLWLNYFCVSTSLTTRELVVHRSGPLSKCVRASNSLPGLLPPVLHEGHILIDGGVLNNQPGDIMKEMCGGPVIVSNVSPRTDPSVEEGHVEMPSAWRVLWSRLNPFSGSIRVPGIPETMMRTLLVASDRKSREVEQQADFYLRPALSQFRLEDWRKIDRIVEAGYECAQREIESWQSAGKLPTETRALPANAG